VSARPNEILPPGLNARTNDEMGTRTRLPAPEMGTTTRLPEPEGEVCEPIARNDHEGQDQPGCDGAMGMEDAGHEDAMGEAGFENAMEELRFKDAMEELVLEDCEEGEDEDDLEAGKEGEGERLIFEEFQKYMEHAKKNRLELTRPFVAGVKLMKLLADNGCALSLYDEIIKWHVDFSDVMEQVSRKVLTKKLCSQCALKHSQPVAKKCHLPFAKVTVPIVCHDFLVEVVSLLMLTCIRDEDYLFHNNDPRQGAPEEFLEVNDINSGTHTEKLMIIYQR
jgi:hypothetical protein